MIAIVCQLLKYTTTLTKQDTHQAIPLIGQKESNYYTSDLQYLFPPLIITTYFEDRK